MNRQQDIVITGLGLTTSLGLTPQQTWSAILDGRSGLGPMTALEQRPAPDKGGAQALDLPKDYQPQLPRAARYLRFTIEHAWRDAFGQTLPNLHPQPRSDRVGIALGTTLHGMRAAGEFLRAGNARKLQSFLAGDLLQLALADFDFPGPRLATCSACSSGLGAIALGATLLRSGQIDVAICGGYDPISEYSYAGFDSLRLIADGLPRPFSADRDGMKVGEGYGIVILERADSAANHSANVLATLAGFGESSDAFHLTQPHPEGSGAAGAMRAALSAAGLAASDVNMIAAHATATPNNDAAEYAALAAVFGSALANVPVVAFKSYVGHTLGGAGAVELVLSVLARQSGCVPSTANTREVDLQMPGLNAVHGRPHVGRIQTTMNLSLGFGGANACMVLADRATPSRATSSSDDAGDHEPVITGIGVVLPGAVGQDAFVKLLDQTHDQIKVAAGALDESLYEPLLNARRTRRMSEYAKLTLAAATAACQHACISENADFLAGCSAILGTTLGSSPFCEAYYGQIVREGLAAANPVLFAEGVPNAAAAHLSMMLGIKGGCQTIIGSRCAGLEALMLASLRIREGLWSRAIVGAAEEFSPIVNSAYRACGLIADDRDFLTASGAVSFVVESRASARSRRARIHAVIGKCAWRSSTGIRSAGDVVDELARPGHISCALGGTKPDQAMMHCLRKRSPESEIWSIATHLPELFSVGPLAALAGALLKPVAAQHSAFSVVASEFSGPSCGISVIPADISGVAPAG